MKKAKILIQLQLVLLIFSLQQVKSLSQCDSCPLPRHPQTKALPVDGTIDVMFKENLPPIYGVSSVKRVTIKKYGKYIQGIQVIRVIDGNCQDTVLLLDDVDKLYSSNLGIGGTTLNIPVLPAREYYYDKEKSSLQSNLLSFSSYFNTIGSDKSYRKIGTDGLTYGLNLSLYPFKEVFGRRTKVGFGTGIFIENGRSRIPIYGSIRYNFLGTEYEEEYFNYFPNPCKFGIEGESPISPNKENLIEIPSKGDVDSTVYFFLDKRVVKDLYRPYLILNGGLLLDTEFEGSGSSPALNQGDYGQFFFQLGVGIPLFEILDISTGLSYYRLNLRTPCIACQNNFVVNTNQALGVFINIGIYLTY